MANRQLKNYLTVSTALRVVVAGMLFFALRKLPYEYFTILKVVTSAAAIYLAYVAYSSKSVGWAVVFGALAALFNPIVKLPIKRESWEIIDVAMGVLLLVSIIFVGADPPSNDEKIDTQPGGW